MTIAVIAVSSSSKKPNEMTGTRERLRALQTPKITAHLEEMYQRYSP
ncbi:MAG: hypothetical protein HY675_29145 [Chloroflexi bacterium]|nr:hypothetical protein [Chloroflexota bacterium]